MGAEYLAPTGIRSPDRPARRKSPYRLKLNPLILRPRLCLLHHHQMMMDDDDGGGGGDVKGDHDAWV